MDRKLTTIFASDVVGFSKMMGEDEVKTLKILKERRTEIDRIIEKNGGVIFGSAGDSVIAEFSSPIKAAEAAVEAQLKMDSMNNFSKKDSMIFRIGINIGDVMISDNNLFGDAVNIAARLEAAAKPSGICISKPVFDMINRKIKVSFENAGQLDLKNIDIPIEAFHVIESKGSHRYTHDAGEIRVKVKEAEPGSIAVMMFKNLSSDEEQNYFCEGFSEDLLLKISQFKQLTVISSNASFAYKDKSSTISEIGKELGIRYLINGSVRKLGPRMRINAQLTSVENENNLWSNNYDLKVEEVFDVQDQIIEEIISTIVGKVEADTMSTINKKNPENMDAYELVLKGLDYARKGGVIKEYTENALDFFDKAIEEDPNYSRAHAWRACTLANLSDWDPENNGPDTVSKVIESMNTALVLDPNEPEVHRLFGSLKLFFDKDYDMAKYHLEKARELCPSDVYIIARYSSVLICFSEFEKALKEIHRALRLDPFSQDLLFENEAICYFWLKNYNGSLISFKKLKVQNTKSLFYMASAFMCEEKETEAKLALKEAITSGSADIDKFCESQPFQNEKHNQELSSILNSINNL
ncbi:MAG: adenylate/guanylate cyclase domain-containing protein [Candidatus Neomarinimicrobiota bacterium]